MRGICIKYVRSGMNMLHVVQEAIEKVLGPPAAAHSSKTATVQAKGPTTPEAGKESLSTPQTPGPDPSLPFEAIQPPVMYTPTPHATAGAEVNARASWLAGKPVHGDAMLSYTKIRHTRWLVPAVVVSSDFTEEVFWQWVHGLLPEVEHVNKAGNSLVTRLPQIFRWAAMCQS